MSHCLRSRLRMQCDASAAAQSLKGSLAEANRRAKGAEDELRIVQRQMERMRETLSTGAPATKLGAILEENHDLKDTLSQLKQQARN